MKKIFLFSAVALALAACDSESENPDSAVAAARIYATIGESAPSRAAGTSWASNDAIGITATVGSLESPDFEPYTNLKYVTSDGTSRFTGTDIYFYKPMTMAAYYPFTGTEGTPSGTITTSTPGRLQTPAEQAKFDFLYDSITGIEAKNPEINFHFAHRMSKITLVFVEADKNVKVANIASYYIDGLLLKGSFNTLNGECMADTSVPGDTIEIQMRKNKVENGKPEPPLIVFPQTISPEKEIELHMSLDEFDNADRLQEYYCTLNFGKDGLQSGYNYKFTVYVTKVGLKLGETSIVDWDSGKDVSITATIDGDPFTSAAD